MDPSDDKFIWCALQGRAEMIVSGDNHLLTLASSPVPVVTVSAFLETEK
jgi:predicted nucleic acid-binding protein